MARTRRVTWMPTQKGGSRMQPQAPAPPSQQPAPEPFEYGWRYVEQTQPDGTIRCDRVPLTLEDVLHPREGDVIPESKDHEIDCRYMADVFSAQPLGPAFVEITADRLIDLRVAG